MKFSKSIVVLVILMAIVFTSATLYVFNNTGNEPSTLIASVFAFLTGELWQLKEIKKSKINSKKKGCETNENDC